MATYNGNGTFANGDSRRRGGGVHLRNAGVRGDLV